MSAWITLAAQFSRYDTPSVLTYLSSRPKPGFVAQASACAPSRKVLSYFFSAFVPRSGSQLPPLAPKNHETNHQLPSSDTVTSAGGAL
jgi:hypothetical protein